MLPLQFIDAIAESLDAVMDDHHVQTEPVSVLSQDMTIAVFPMAWTPDEASALIGSIEPTLNHYHIRIQNLTIHGDIHVAYEAFTNDQRKIRAILYRDQTLSVALAAMQESYLGSIERFKRLNVVRQTTLPGRQNLAMYFLCETDIIIDTETSRTT